MCTLLLTARFFGSDTKNFDLFWIWFIWRWLAFNLTIKLFCVIFYLATCWWGCLLPPWWFVYNDARWGIIATLILRTNLLSANYRTTVVVDFRITSRDKIRAWPGSSLDDIYEFNKTYVKSTCCSGLPCSGPFLWFGSDMARSATIKLGWSIPFQPFTEL